MASPNPSTMRKLHRIPTGKVREPEADAPIYGTYPDAKMEGADECVENSAWGDTQEMPVDVKITNGMGKE